jgi:hypothetical protein
VLKLRVKEIVGVEPVLVLLLVLFLFPPVVVELVELLVGAETGVMDTPGGTPPPPVVVFCVVWVKFNPTGVLSEKREKS